MSNAADSHDLIRVQMAQQIADHVGGAYRPPSGQQLVGIQAAPPRIQDVPLGAIAVRHLPTDPTPVNVMAPDGTVVHIMCGLGDVAFLPPSPGEEPGYALFFERGPFSTQPLRTTLSAIIPP